MARAARGGVHVGAGDELHRLVRGAHALRERGVVAAAVRADGGQLVHGLGEGHEGEDVAEGSPAEIRVERGDDDGFPERGPLFAKLGDVAEELALVDADDVVGVDDVVHLRERARGERGERLAVVRHHAPAQSDGARRRRRRREMVVPRVVGVLHHEALAVRRLVAADATRQLRGLAGKHRPWDRGGGGKGAGVGGYRGAIRARAGRRSSAGKGASAVPRTDGVRCGGAGEDAPKMTCSDPRGGFATVPAALSYAPLVVISTSRAEGPAPRASLWCEARSCCRIQTALLSRLRGNSPALQHHDMCRASVVTCTSTHAGPSRSDAFSLLPRVSTPSRARSTAARVFRGGRSGHGGAFTTRSRACFAACTRSTRCCRASPRTTWARSPRSSTRRRQPGPPG